MASTAFGTACSAIFARQESSCTSPSKWHVHIGAHKTATTHVQDTLAAVRERLAENGVVYVPRDRFRNEGGLPESGVLGRLRHRLGFSRTRVSVPAWLDAVDRDNEVLLLSEENLIGKASELLEERLYPRAEERIARLGAMAGDRSLTVFLAVRSLDTLLPSAYAQRCRMGNAKTGDFDKIRHRVLYRPPRWSELVSRLLNVLRPDQLRVWTFEDYVREPARFLSLLCEDRIENFPHLPPPASTRSPSAEAIRSLEKIDPKMRRSERRRLSAAICEEFAFGEAYKPFGRDEVQFLKSSYANDLNEIAVRYPGLLLS